jgi:hypothetical protein
MDLFLSGDEEAALTALLEPPEEILPPLAQLFRGQADSAQRAFMVRVAWERREPTSIDLIVEALNDPAEEVWQAALDGTVALASPEILDVLNSMRQQERVDAAQTRRFQMCVEDAINYVEGLLEGGQRPQKISIPPGFKN